MKKSIFKFDSYRPDITTEMDIKVVRKEYSRLRAIAQKRLKRLSETEFAQDATYGEYYDYFEPLKEMSEVDLPYYLADLSSWLRRKQSTVKGAREMQKETIERFRKKGLDINTDNLREFLQFLNDIAEESDSEKYDSKQTLVVWKYTDSLGLDKSKVHRDFDFWLKNRHRIADKEEMIKGKGLSYEEIKRVISNRST